ncbi:unnamed protein product, partial [Rhizoctonia solani]
MTTSTDVLQHQVYNVFLPPRLPQKEQEERFQQSVDLAIIDSLVKASQQYRVEVEQSLQWIHIERMLQHLHSYTEYPIEVGQLGQDMKNMRSGDVLCLYIKAQNAGLIIRKHDDHTIFEVFEAQAQTEHVMSVPGKIVRSFPGPAVQLPNNVANDCDFVNEVANILCQMNTEIFDEAHPKTRKAGTDVRESRNSINPNYFIQFFFGFLRGLGKSIVPPAIVKRLGDEVLWMDAKNPWRRSPIWLIIRVALQTSLDSNDTYKHFMVYYHAAILSESCECGSFSSELFYAMRVKMARRLYKVEKTAPQFLIDTVKAAAEETEEILQGRWGAIQSAQAQSLNSDFSGIDFESAINQTLPHSRTYLEQVFDRQLVHIQPSKFHPKHSARLGNVVDFSSYANGALSRVFATDPDLALFDFEASIFGNLTGWTSKQTDYTKACMLMSSCFEQYLTAAKSHYTVDVADQSIMMLTLVRIWMAIDELATRDCPLLCEYSPELPQDILDLLLLRTTQHIEQARLIQQYIRKRHLGASSSSPSIFSDKATATCFAVRYFESSSHHQQLKATIEAYAQGQKNQKIKKLNELNAKHARLCTEISTMSHGYHYTINGKQKHSKSCVRCALERERSNLKIQPYEWPLPYRRLDAEAVVFELERPGPFVVWRNITYEVLMDLGTSSPRDRCKQHATLEGYSALGSWLSPPAGIASRVTIASSTKSFNNSHYNNTLKIPASESQVCLDNALQFNLYDKSGDAWAAGPFPHVTFMQYGTMKLPTKSMYHHLKYAVEGTSHSSNQVLADQHDCPKDLSLHEHIAFGTLRSGARLQWMNIVRGLEEDSLTFSAEEVRLLHTQAAWQIGPLLDDGSREWHKEPDGLDFGNLLIFLCKRMLIRVKANWLQAASVSMIVTLISRLLASSPAQEIVEESLIFLREARDVTHDWLEQLKAKLQSATDGDDVINYQRRVCEMASICRATYDIEPRYIGRLLLTRDDYIPLIKSSVCLYDNLPPSTNNAPISIQVLLCRDRRFAHKVVPYMICHTDILSKPLSQIWPDYLQGPDGLRVYKAPNNRWITTTTAENTEYRKQDVHFNVLTGELLIDGKPLGRLPRQYVEQETYVRLFGQKILEVVPAKSRGMEFTTRDHVHGYQVSFALKGNNKQLIIQARKDDRLYELIPHTTLAADFPLFFSQDYHHWANITARTIEFCPLSAPWSMGESQWLLHFSNSRKTSLKNSSKGSFLIDIHSIPFQSLAHSIGPLESDRYLHITRSSEGQVEIELPRMKLSFFINEEKQLESRNFRGQVLDENQSAGTLFGLKNQLLLRAKGTLARSLPQCRSILLPDGEITYASSGHHVTVSIQPSSHRDVDVYRYKIDNDLNRLATDAGLTSRLVKIYLHALTSHCLADPLTGRTGTEEALHELSQASTSSFEQISLKQAKLLKAIGSLTPRRKYYPAHLTCMQTIHWVNLPALSQHFGFSSSVATILRRADTLQLFSPLDFQIEEYLDALSPLDTLLKRAARRSGPYYPSDTTSNILHILDSSALSDSVHPGRDNFAGDWDEAGQAASWAAVSLAESWGTLEDSEEHTSLTYRSSWFELNLKKSWISFYNLLRHAQHVVALSGVWPRINSRDVLEQISFRKRSRVISLAKWWRELIGHAQVFAHYQRSQRLIALVESKSVEEFYKELDLASNDASDINDPDWLLVQIDGNFGARAVQRQVAKEMISPSSGSNTVLQLNMGEGKSSVIVPIIASSLADSSRLVRVIVLKPLWRQMFELLVNRLSGLCNRRIYYLPFGRHLQIDGSGAQKLRTLYEECMRDGGVLLAQPEHILSFKLMGIDRLISSSGSTETGVANSLRNMQNWLTQNTRDILDESDEILHVRYQLVYTTGEQQPLDNHPDRWTTTQQLLYLAATHVERLEREYPDDISHSFRASGQFPVLRIMPNCKSEIEKKLISSIAADVQDGRLMNLNCDCLKPSVREVLPDFFVNEKVSYPTYEFLRKNCDSTIWKGLLLIRGLLASGILVFALKRKHYRVDYGLDLSRSLLAVPYRAKDLPSLRAEFGHPDVAVVLTCLSYYYQGLTHQQLDLCFEMLFKLDNPSLEYEQWVQRDSSIPDDLRQLNGVNIKDRQQFVERLVPTFSRNSGAVDFYLSSVVFPKEAK